MPDQIQDMIDSAMRHMLEAESRTNSAASSTRVLHSFVTVLASHFLDERQQSQVEELLVINERCVRRETRKATL